MTYMSIMLLLASSAQQEPTKYSHLHMPLHGTMYRGELYGLFELKQPTYYILHSIDLKKSGKEVQNRYTSLLQGGGGYHRHRILFNRLWLGDGTPGIKSLSFDDLNGFEDRASLKARNAYFEKYDTGNIAEEPDVIYLGGLKKHVGLNGPMSFVFVPAEGVAGIGTVPTSESTLKTFLLLKEKKHMEVWDTKARFDAKSKRWKEAADLQNLETIDSPFLEDFYVFIRKDVYYFVTESGKLYFAPTRAPSEKSRTIQELWWDAKRPIVAVMEDADRDKVWLFAKDKNAGAKYDLYFEMKETVRYELFDPAKLRPVNVEGRAKVLLEYLPLIRNEPKK